MFVAFFLPFPHTTVNKVNTTPAQRSVLPRGFCGGCLRLRGYRWQLTDCWHTHRFKNLGIYMKIHIFGFSWKVKRIGSTIPISPNGNTQLQVVLAVFFRLDIWTVIHLRPHRSLLSPQTSLFQSFTILSWSLKSHKFALNFNLYLS